MYAYIYAYIYKHIFMHAPPWGLSSLAKELPAAASVMQSSLKELSTLVRLVGEWSESQSSLKLDGFRSRLRASCVSNHTEEF